MFLGLFSRGVVWSGFSVRVRLLVCLFNSFFRRLEEIVRLLLRRVVDFVLADIG